MTVTDIYSLPAPERAEPFFVLQEERSAALLPQWAEVEQLIRSTAYGREYILEMPYFGLSWMMAFDPFGKYPERYQTLQRERPKEFDALVQASRNACLKSIVRSLLHDVPRWKNRTDGFDALCRLVLDYDPAQYS